SYLTQRQVVTDRNTTPELQRTIIRIKAVRKGRNAQNHDPCGDTRFSDVRYFNTGCSNSAVRFWRNCRSEIYVQVLADYHCKCRPTDHGCSAPGSNPESARNSRKTGELRESKHALRQ